MKNNHPSSKEQRQIVAEIVAKLVSENNKDNHIYQDIRVLGSDFSNDVFINYSKITPDWNNNRPKEEIKYISISLKGKIDYKANKMEFKTVPDRVHFFNNLYEIDL